MKHSAQKYLACLTLLAAGCTMPDDWGPTEPPIDDEPPDEIFGTCRQNLRSGNTDGCEMQGRHVLGEKLQDGSTYFYFSSTATEQSGAEVTLALTGDASLTATPKGSGAGLPYPDTDTRFDHMKLTGPYGELEILSRTSVGNVSLFELELKNAEYPNGVNPCIEGVAIPMAGYFDSRAAHKPHAGRISFSCWFEGVGAKCTSWNFPAANGGAGSTKWKANQVCMRAAMNDFCKDGTPHTLEETFIRITDTYEPLGFGRPPATFPGLSQWPPQRDIYKFESAWPEDDNRPALCLTKARWEGLQDDELASCSADLPDPRTTRSAHFCEDPRVDLGAASLFIESPYASLRLQQWGDGTDLFATVSGYYPGQVGGPIPVRAPLPDAEVPVPDPNYRPLTTMGMIMRSLPGSISLDEMNQVLTYSNAAGDHFLGRATATDWAPPAGYSEPTAWEGMVFKEERADLPFDYQLLRLYQVRTPGGPGEYVNSTDDLSATHDLIDELGYLPAQ
jgi:hypothetical protein